MIRVNIQPIFMIVLESDLEDIKRGLIVLAKNKKIHKKGNMYECV